MQTTRSAPLPAIPGNPAERSYRPRRAEETIVHQVVRDHLQEFLEQARERDRPVPRFIEREMRDFLDCGDPSRGFLFLRCPTCRFGRAVPLACKTRAVCSSCGARRMADTAAHLVDSVLPEVPVRQWVLSLPFGLRYRLAYDAPLLSDVIGIFVRAVFASYRRRARRRTRLHWPQGGAVTFVQRFSDSLRVNVHLHTLLLDGVYEAHPAHPARFVSLPPPDTAEVARVARRVARHLARHLERRGLGADADPSETDTFAADEPLLAALYSASVRGRIALGARAGQQDLRLGDRVDVEDLKAGEKERCAGAGGVNVHANVCVPARDRRRLERLCRYAGRPPLATARLSRLADRRLAYSLKRRHRDGTTHMVYEPLELLGRLAALIPPPRAHQLRYHGCLAPAAGLRARIVPAAPILAPDLPEACAVSARATARTPIPRRADGAARAPMLPVENEAASDVRRSPSLRRTNVSAAGGAKSPRRRTYHSWSELLQRVLEIDAQVCAQCGDRMQILGVVESPDAIRAILTTLGLPSRAPPGPPPVDCDELVPFPTT